MMPNSFLNLVPGKDFRVRTELKLVLVLLTTMYSYAYESSQGDVRLSGSVADSGRIEIYNSGAWEVICTDHFSYNEALVVCRQLILGTTDIKIHNFTRSSDPIGLHYVTCSGAEDNIASCTILHWGLDGNDTCSDNQEAGVECGSSVEDGTAANTTTTTSTTTTTTVPPDGTVRLSGSSDSISGRVEIRWAGLWGTVCYSEFSSNEATVFCRQLDLVHDKFTIKPSTFFGQGAGTIWNVSCIGNETTVIECAVVRGTGVCNTHSQDVGVICGLDESTIPNIDLSTSGNETFHAWMYVYFVIPFVIGGIISAVIWYRCNKKARAKRQQNNMQQIEGPTNALDDPRFGGSFSGVYQRETQRERQLKIQQELRVRNSLRTFESRNNARLNGALHLNNTTEPIAEVDEEVVSSRTQVPQTHNYLSPCDNSNSIFTTETSNTMHSQPAAATQPTPLDVNPSITTPQQQQSTMLTPTTQTTSQEEQPPQQAAQPRFYHYQPNSLPAYSLEFDSPYPPSYESLYSKGSAGNAQSNRTSAQIRHALPVNQTQSSGRGVGITASASGESLQDTAL